jgi:hypothetical protein
LRRRKRQRDLLQRQHDKHAEDDDDRARELARDFPSRGLSEPIRFST